MKNPGFAFRRRSRLFFSLSALALLAGCGDGEDGGSSSSGVFTIGATSGGSGALGSYYMASLTQQWRDAAASFRNNSARFIYQNGTVNIGGSPVFTNALHSSRVDYAHALGLSGAGQVIAVVDAGFLQSHEAFQGKVNRTTGSPGTDDHGTKVASVAAGDSPTMVGVAPDADLIFSDWGFNGSSNTYADLEAAAIAAKTRGAVAQNNSWGYTTLFANQTDYNTLRSIPGAVDWLDALKDYASDGVVVFALSNDETDINAELMAGLPAVDPSLTSGWLAVGNAVGLFDDNGVFAVGARYSAGCLQAARWCLMADGYWLAATDTANNAYATAFGSSFAAPQVSGALALLAEAFPLLSPNDLRARILASADNTFTGFVSAGSVDLLEGDGTFLHAYSTEFGHGFLDIRAALLPIGAITMAAADGGTVRTEDFTFSSGGAMGDAVTRSLDGIDLTVTDALAAGFDVPAKDFAREAATTPLAETLAARTFGRDLKALREASISPLADTFAAHPGNTLEVVGPDGATRAAVLISDGDNMGLALSRTLTEGDLKLDLGVKVARDDGTLMGFSDSSGGGADMASLTLALSHDTGAGGFFALTGEVGIADLATTTAVSDTSTAGYNSLGLDIGSRGVFASGDRLALGLSMPIATTSGSADMIVPVARGDGTSEVRSISVD
ncbi:MAG: hypothetical protein B7Z10_08000, partial [Rhodobacterales bacterium 32-66-7]